MTECFLVVLVAASTYVLTRAQCDNEFRAFLSKTLRFSEDDLKGFDQQGGWRAH